MARHDLVIAGCFCGRVVAKRLSTGSIVWDKRITTGDSSVINAIDVDEDTVLISGNDERLRLFNQQTFQEEYSVEFLKPVNHSTMEPAGKMVVVGLDDTTCHLIDKDSGQRVAKIPGHDEYVFATGWHPTPGTHIFATGAQDRTCRLWDVQNLSESLVVLKDFAGAVRSVNFSSCGRFLAVAEPRDFVKIFDVENGKFDTCQVIDLFGEIAGVSFTPNSQRLYLGISDRTYASLISFNRCKG